MSDMDSMVSDLASELGFGGGEADEGSANEAPESDAAEASPPPEPAVQDEGEASVAGAEPAAPAVTIPPPPKTWRPDALTHWEALPEQVRAEVLKREEDMFRGLEQYKAQADSAKALTDVVQPYTGLMQQYGVQPQAVVGNLLAAHKTLAFGTPLQKMEIFRKVAADYGVDLTGFGQLPEGEDPRLLNLSRELASTKQGLQTILQSQAQTVAKEAESTVNSFISAVDDAGKPLHPYFNDVSSDIVTLLNTGVSKTLDDAYTRAIWANPLTRDKEISRIQQEKGAKAAAEAKAAEEARNRAGTVKVRTSAKAATAGSPLGSMDDTLKETLAAIEARG